VVEEVEADPRETARVPGVTLQEHHNLDLARTLIGLSEDEAEAFFGKPVEGTSVRRRFALIAAVGTA